MKKAYLVTFMPCTRVIVDENASEDDIIIAAVERMHKHADEYISMENFSALDEDKECPYDPETDEGEPDQPILGPCGKPFAHFVKGIDFEMLKGQKRELLNLLNSRYLVEEELNALQGILNLIDHLQDFTVESGLKTDAEVFTHEEEPAEPARAFIHPDLKNDFGAGLLPETGVYLTQVVKTNGEPEQFELSIYEDGNGVNSLYQYDSQDDAFEDLTTFHAKIKQPA